MTRRNVAQQLSELELERDPRRRRRQLAELGSRILRADQTKKREQTPKREPDPVPEPGSARSKMGGRRYLNFETCCEARNPARDQT
jgi:hypothetical protein